jgi:hypothetical protein
MLTPRENMLRVFRHQEPEWVPLTTICDRYTRPIHLPDQFFRDSSINPTWALTRYLDIDYWDRCSAYTVNYRNVEYTTTVGGDSTTERWETPYGIITARNQIVRFATPIPGEPMLETPFPAEYPIKSVDDYRAFAYIIENMVYEFQPEVPAQRAKETGERGVVVAAAPSSPLGMCVRMYMGVEHLGLASYEHPHELRDLLEKIGAKYLEAYRGIALTVADATINYDDTTTRAISPRMFRELEVPFLNKAADVLHAKGKFFIHHACGHVLHLLEDMRGTNIDILDGPYAPPVGDTPMTEAKRGLGGNIVTTVPIDDETVQSNDPDAIRSYIRGMFADAGERRNLIICLVPPTAGPVGSLWVAVDEAKRLSHGAPRRWY